MGYYATPRCSNCGTTFEGLKGRDITSLPPCPECGATDWGFHIDLQAAVTGSASVVEQRDITDAVGITDSVSATITPEAVRLGFTIPEPTISVDELPTEVIAEALQVGINILRPIDGQWAIEVTGFGIVGYVGVGDLDDGVLGSAEWIADLARRWEQKLQDNEGDSL